jgi:predicted esterase
MTTCLLRLISITAFIVSWFLVSAGQAIQPGTLVEKVVIQTEPDQSYAIYLPANYSTTQKWPTVFCFDPGARGKVALEHLRSAAEMFGYIVVCSNNSRNGLDADVVTKIVTVFWRDVHDRFAVDEQRTYFAGFSGGARLSVGLANRCNGCVAGVIAGGAGYPGDQQPDAKTNFDFVGVVGYDDFNFGEVRELENKFEELKKPHRFYQVAGGHEWPPASVFESAFAWFNVQSMKRGTLAKDEKFLNERFANEYADAQVLRAKQQLVEARSAFLSLVQDFSSLRHMSDPVQELAGLLNSSELKKQLQQESELYRRQLKEAYDIRGLWMRPRSPDEDLTSRSEARSRIRDWNKKKDESEDSKDRRLARRIISSLRVGGYESARDALRGKNYSVAIANMEMVRAIDPTSANAAYELARALALNNEKRAALSSLEEAVQLGFKDNERLKSDPAFTSLTNESRFQKLLAAMSDKL